jgi:hypothetical protein
MRSLLDPNVVIFIPSLKLSCPPRVLSSGNKITLYIIKEDIRMKKYGIVGLVLALAAFAGMATAGPGKQNCGERCDNCDKQGGAGGHGRMYDAAKAETVTGDVVSVGQVSRKGQGIGLTLKTGNGTMTVHLGPNWYFERAGGLKIKAGDTVEVKGVRSLRRGDEVFIAAEVKKGGDVLKLRDEQGVPIWAGERRCNS